jgi:hypothetical protein
MDVHCYILGDPDPTTELTHRSGTSSCLCVLGCQRWQLYFFSIFHFFLQKELVVFDKSVDRVDTLDTLDVGVSHDILYTFAL